MTDKEKLEAIRAEFHRLKEVRGVYKGIFNDIFAFMDSLPKEPVSEGLEEAAIDYATKEAAKDISGDWTTDDILNAFKAGANAVLEEIIKCLPNTPSFNPNEVIDIITSKIKQLKGE